MLSERFTFSRNQAANYFFGRSRWWLERHERTPLVLPSGKLIVTPTTDTGRKVYTLEHIQDVALALMMRGELDQERAAKIFVLLEMTSDLWEGTHHGRL